MIYRYQYVTISSEPVMRLYPEVKSFAQPVKILVLCTYGHTINFYMSCQHVVFVQHNQSLFTLI